MHRLLLTLKQEHTHLLPMAAAQYYLILQKLTEISMCAFQLKVTLLLIISNALNISVNTTKELSGRLIKYNDGISFQIK